MLNFNYNENNKISKTNSTAIKGLAILLIILGHNHILAPQNEGIFNYLYSFHIYIFFILPFFYDKKIQLSKKNIINCIVRFYIPYIIFFTFSYFIYHSFILKDDINLKEFITGFFNIGGYNCKNTTGFQFIWFLPAFCMYNLYRILTSKYPYLSYLYIIIGILAQISDIFHNLIFSFPFYIGQGFYYISIGLLTVLLTNVLPSSKKVLPFIFITISVLYFLDFIKKPYIFIFSISGFFFIKWIAQLISEYKIIKILGDNSLLIYLVHVYLYNALERLFPFNLFFGYVNYLLTIILSIYISIWINNNIILRNLIIPKDFKSWINLFLAKK